jgi:DNA repair exonuclease SbcCD ATPase subunit
MNRLDHIESLLDSDNLSNEQRAKLEAEADELANRLSKNQEKQKQRDIELLEKRRQIAALYKLGDGTLYKVFGHEFIDDYESAVEGTDHVVYSKVARDDQNTRWVCKTAEEAEAKVKQLIEWRVWKHYRVDDLEV